MVCTCIYPLEKRRNDVPIPRLRKQRRRSVEPSSETATGQCGIERLRRTAAAVGLAERRESDPVPRSDSRTSLSASPALANPAPDRLALLTATFGCKTIRQTPSSCAGARLCVRGVSKGWPLFVNFLCSVKRLAKNRAHVQAGKEGSVFGRGAGGR